MVNKERIRLLVTALRSGEYQQGHSRLHCIIQDGDHTWCCLGVAGDVACRNGLEVERVISSISGLLDYPAKECIDGSYVQLGPAVRDWYGFVNLDPKLLSRGSAIGWNDAGRTFEEIAQAFEDMYLREDTP